MHEVLPQLFWLKSAHASKTARDSRSEVAEPRHGLRRAGSSVAMAVFLQRRGNAELFRTV